MNKYQFFEGDVFVGGLQDKLKSLEFEKRVKSLGNGDDKNKK